MAKNGSGQKLIFWKNISSDLALVLRNFALWVNENDEIWSVVAFHEKFFRVPKLRFLAGPASLLDEVSRGTQNWSVRAVTISNQSISVTFQTFRPFWVIWGHFRPFLAISGHFGPKFKIVADKSCDHSKWPQKKQKSNEDGFGCHYSDIQAIFGHLGPFWPILWPLKTFARGEEHDHSLTGYSHWKSIQSLKHCPCSSLILIFLKKRRNALLWKLVLSW